MRTLKTSRRELEHVAVCVTGEVSAEFIRDIQETMRRENQRRRDAGRPGMSYTVSGGEGSPEEWIRKALNQDLGNGAARTVRCVQGPVVRLALTGRQAAALRAAVEMELAHQYKIMTVPTLLFFKGGKLVFQNSGVINRKQLESMLERLG